MPSAQTRRPFILVIDDEPLVAAVIVETLVLVGYEVETAKNGREALEKIAACSYDLILSDLRMPELQFMLATDVAVVDHSDGTILLIANVIRGLTPHADEDPGQVVPRAVATRAEVDVGVEPSEGDRTDVERRRAPGSGGDRDDVRAHPGDCEGGEPRGGAHGRAGLSAAGGRA